MRRVAVCDVWPLPGVSADGVFRGPRAACPGGAIC